MVMSEVPINRDLWRSLRQQIARRTRNPADAEDLLHSAYLRMVRYEAAHEVSNPAAFLVRTACNIEIDRYRHDKVVTDEGDAFQVEDSFPLQDEVIAARARLERVRAGLERLNPKTREIFLMSRLRNMKYSEIGKNFGISPSAVEKHVAKALLFLSEWTNGW